ncbi:MAG: DUF1553 domain-containing protein [Verrucomicrobiota bacterium]
MNEEMQKELEKLLEKQLGGEEALSGEEAGRLNEILEGSEEARAWYVGHCGMEGMLLEEDGMMKALAEEMGAEEDGKVVAMPGVGEGRREEEEEEEMVLGWGGLIRVVAACLVIGLAAWGLLAGIGGGEGEDVRGEVAATPRVEGEEEVEVEEEEEEVLSPEEAYRLKMLAVVGTGSMDRPPTGFEAVADGEAVDFNRDIRPILSEYCFHCHGPDAADRKADLRVDTEEGIFADLGGYAAVVAGKPEESELMYRVLHEDADEVMPPPKSNKVISAREKKLLSRWIEEGAEWRDHWAFEPVERPQTPGHPSLLVNGYRIKHPIDAFTRARLKGTGLTGAPPADRATLARRVTLDLTGLPPTPEEVQAFVSDEREDAYGQLVDRLLESPRFGEHRARYWLDAARYADTHGFHFDNSRSVWPYRDWVVNAFNANMPFDQFTIEQLAGDLLPDATLEQKIATGFNRCNPTTNEGGVINEEYLSIYAKDRVETTGTVFMGLTMNCTSCHDHKFDPLTQKEYYEMEAFFRNTTQPARDGNKPDSPPNLIVPPVEDRPRWAELAKELAAYDGRMVKREKAALPEFEKWAASAKPGDFEKRVKAAELVYQLGAGEGRESINAAVPDQEPVVLAKGLVWKEEAERPEAVLRFDGEGGQKISLGRDRDELSKALAFDKGDSFSYGGWVKVPEGMKGGAAVLARMDENNSHKGWDLWVENGKKFGVHLIASWPKNSIKVLTKTDVLKPGEWMHLFATYDGSGKASGVTLYLNGERKATAAASDKLSESIRVTIPVWLGQRSRKAIFTGGEVSDVRVYGRKLSGVEVAALADSAHFETILATAPEERTKRQIDDLLEYYLETTDKPMADLRRGKGKLTAEKREIQDRSVITLVTEEKEGEEPFSHILNRGEYDQPGEKVGPGVPEVLPPMGDELPRNRLGFAQWLVSGEHPLTARVTVNRYWQELFGTGLVKSSEDFGVMGEPPSHPKLMDWLAAEFVESGWDVKHLFRTMVTSDTYKQSSVVSEEAYGIDPENRFLARGPRFRLDAETLRDQALYVSGLMVETMGGPGVRPYQPAGLWKVVAYPKSDTANFVQDEGDKLYRRTLYTFWKRTSPPPSMSILDAPERESCIVRRERTNTPLQALVMMNDPQFVEAARHLATRVLREEGLERSGRIDRMGWIVLQRGLSERERVVLEESLGIFEDVYLGDEAEARGLVEVGDSAVPEDLDVGELAAWMMLANQMLNLDEVVNKN